MKVGLVVPQTGAHVALESLTRFATDAESLGYDSLWVQEHLFYPLNAESDFGGRADATMPDAYRYQLDAISVLAYLAASTDSIGLGSSMFVAGYHRPVQLAKTAATIDVLSRGRLKVGIGVGWSREEHALSDVEFRTRGARADELLDALTKCWDSDPVDYDGAYFTIPRCLTSPKPVNGAIPLVGGFRSAKGLRRVAKYCDWWQPSGIDAEEARRTIAFITASAHDDFERPPVRLSVRVFAAPQLEGFPRATSTIDRPTWTESPSSMVRRLDSYLVNGCDEVVIDCSFTGGTGEGWWERIPESLQPLLIAAHESD